MKHKFRMNEELICEFKRALRSEGVMHQYKIGKAINMDRGRLSLILNGHEPMTDGLMLVIEKMLPLYFHGWLVPAIEAHKESNNG